MKVYYPLFWSSQGRAKASQTETAAMVPSFFVNIVHTALVRSLSPCANGVLEQVLLPKVATGVKWQRLCFGFDAKVRRQGAGVQQGRRYPQLGQLQRVRNHCEPKLCRVDLPARVNGRLNCL